MIVEKINAYLSGAGKTLDEAVLSDVANLARWSFERQFGVREKKSRTLRLSSIGRCLRQQAYNVLGFETNGKELDGRAKMVFFQGDMTELAIVGLAKAAGCNIQNTGQDQALALINGVEGHPDGILLENGHKYLFEAKSMSSYGFGVFEQGTIDDGYRYQVNAYMAALKLEQCVIVALNKDAGVLGEMLVTIDPEIVADIKTRLGFLIGLTPLSKREENLPERPYAANEKGFLPWNCLYCPFHFTCWPASKKVLVGKSYKLKEK